MHFVDVTTRVVFSLNSSQWAGGPHHNKKDHLAGLISFNAVAASISCASIQTINWQPKKQNKIVGLSLMRPHTHIYGAANALLYIIHGELKERKKRQWCENHGEKHSAAGASI